MNAKSKKSGTGWSKADRRKITAEDYDEMPEWTEEQLDRAEFAIGGEVIRPAQGTLTRKRGRPPVASPKAMVSFRVDADVLESIRANPDVKQKAIKAFERAARKSA